MALLQNIRGAFQVLLGRRYEAASHGKRAKGWVPQTTDADSEIKLGQMTVRARAREAVINNPHAASMVRVAVASTVGVGLRASITSASSARQAKARRAWKTWAESTQCDFYGRHTFYGLQALILRTVLVDGEVFVRRQKKTAGAVPFTLQVIDPDLLASDLEALASTTPSAVTASTDELPASHSLHGGIELDKMGVVAAYWMHKYHPNSTNTTRGSYDIVRIPAAEMLHIFVQDRPGQLRGISQLAPVLTTLRDLREFADASLMRHKVAACFAAFVSDTGEARPGDESYGGYPLERLEPGQIEYLAPGQQVTFASPPESRTYDEYTSAVLQSVSAGFGVTYEATSGNLSKVNFSSGRMGWIEAGRHFRNLQNNVLISQLCQPVFLWFQEATAVNNAVPAGDMSCSWTAPRRELIDPAKEIKGLEALVRAGFGSWQDVVAELGNDPDDLKAKLAADMAMFDEIRANPTSDPRFDPARMKINDNEQQGQNGPV